MRRPIKYLDAVANSDKTIQPPPDPGQVYLAKYFGNVARLDAGKIPEAKKGTGRSNYLAKDGNAQ